MEHRARQECIEKTFDFNEKESYAKIIKEYDKQMIMIEKCIQEEKLTEVEKMDDKITHWKNEEMKILMWIKFLNLMTVETFLSQDF